MSTKHKALKAVPHTAVDEHAAVASDAPASAPLAATVAQPEPASAHAEASPWANPETWITVSFVIFLALFAKFVWPKIGAMLDGRAAKIRDQLEQANRLRNEAQLLLASYQKAQAELLKEAHSILATAQKDADALRANAETELQHALERRSQQAQEKIARAEAEAITHIRTQIVDAATVKARDILAQQADSATDEAAVSNAIRMIEQQVH